MSQYFMPVPEVLEVPLKWTEVPAASDFTGTVNIHQSPGQAPVT